MAAKYQLITELYRRTGVAVAKNPQAWQGFLSSACRNYKCRFDEQLLIYAGADRTAQGALLPEPKSSRRRKGSGQGRDFRYFGAAESYPKGGQTVRGHFRP